MVVSFRCMSQQWLKHAGWLVTLRHPTGDHVVVGSYDRRVVRCFFDWDGGRVQGMLAILLYLTRIDPVLVWNDGFCYDSLSFRPSQDWVNVMGKMALHDKPDRMVRNLKGFRVMSLNGNSFGYIARSSLWQYSWIKTSKSKTAPILIDNYNINQ